MSGPLCKPTLISTTLAECQISRGPRCRCTGGIAGGHHKKGPKAYARHRPKMWAHQPKYQTYSLEGAAWFGFEAVRELTGLPSETLLVPLPGHTMGHCGVRARRRRGLAARRPVTPISTARSASAQP